MHLSPKMTQAIDLLFAGHSAVSVASQIGVHRNTIARWRSSHAAFIAAYNRRRSETADDLTRRITGILEAAIANVERHITTTRKPNPEQIRASLRLISSLSRSRRVFANGPTDPFAVLDQMIRYDPLPLRQTRPHLHRRQDPAPPTSAATPSASPIRRPTSTSPTPRPSASTPATPPISPPTPWDKKKPARTKDPLA